MARIDDAIQEITQKTDYIFDYDHNIEYHYNRLKNLSFIAEIDHDVVYIFQVNNIKDPISDAVRLLTEDEQEYIYTNKKFPSHISKFYLNSAGLWKFEMGLYNPTVTYIVTDNGNLQRSPKQNYAEAWEKYSNRYAYLDKKHIENPDNIKIFFAFNSKDIGADQVKVWQDLKKIFETAKTKEIATIPNFTKKIYYDISTYWGDPLELHEEQNYQTEPYDIWQIPLNKFKYVGLDRETEFVIGKVITLPTGNDVIIGGVDYESINFTYPQGLIRTFTTMKDFRNYLGTIIKYINNMFLAGHTNGLTQLYRQYFNNQWPIGTKLNNKYILKICKWKGYFIIECEIWEHGLVYKLTNFKIYK